MRERPIPYSPGMVRARREGRKTQTRRVVKPQPLNSHFNPPSYEDNEAGDIFICPDLLYPNTRVFVEYEGGGRYHNMGADVFTKKHCPYGQPGDFLWVREAWRTLDIYDAMPPRDVPLSAPIWYEADGPAPEGFGRYRHARFMPRWVSRSMDEVVGVRVERLQEISDSDAFAEGVEKTSYGCHKHTPGGHGCMTGRDGYRSLWESINGPGSWDANPWVWVVEFKRVTP